MSWEVVEMRSFLSERKGRFKPNDQSIAGLKRIEKIDFTGKIYLSEKPSKTDMILVKKGDLVISGINVEKGAMSIYKGDEDVTATIHYSSYVYNPQKIDIEFLKHFLKSAEFIVALKEQVPGGIKTEIKPKHILPLKVYIPTSINEQRKLVEFLDKQNKTIETQSSVLTHQLLLVKQLSQAFLREAMQGKLVEQNEAEEPATELLAKIKAEKEQLIKEKKIKKQKPLLPISENEIPFEIPKSWVWCRLGEITSLVTDGKHGDCRNQKESGYYFLSAKDLQLNKFVYEGAREITYNDFQETHNRTNLEPGDLCVVNTGATIGKTVIAPETQLTRKTTFQKSVAVVKFFKSFTSVHFMEYLVILQTPTLLKTSRGSAINNLLLGDMRNMVLPLPPLSEQKRIVAKLDELMAYCDSLEESIKNSQVQNEMLLGQVLREALEPASAEASAGKPEEKEVVA